MPELPEVEWTRRRIAPSLVRARIAAVEVRRPDLRKPFPRHFARRLAGQQVVALTRRGKYLLASLSSAGTLLMHLGMSGSIRVSRNTASHRVEPRPAARDPHDHVVFHLSSGRVVVFNDPRRFGVIELIEPGELSSHPVLSRLGPEPLSGEFDAATLARRCRGRRISLKTALMDQRVVAGLGNIYASEALHVAGLSPRRRASTLATPSGAPREAAHRLAAAIKQVLENAIARQSRAADYHENAFLVYDRQNEPCPRAACAGAIRRYQQAGRSTFYCPVCQR
jgi:formamidopyrimidine-DNA glycosylase